MTGTAGFSGLPRGPWMLWVLGALMGALAFAWAGLAALGASRWATATQSLLTALQAERHPPASARYDARELEGLPAPVQRYFRAVLQDGQSIVTHVVMSQTGTFNLAGFKPRERWTPFTAQQHVMTERPGLFWDARLALAPGLAVRVHDAYVGGVGTLQVRLLGLFSLANAQGGGEIARGELMRYLMEAVWYPTALLPSQGTQWRAVDDTSADATRVDGGLRIKMRFGFGAAGLVEWARVDARDALIDGQLVMLPWEGRFSDVQTCAGLRVPLSGEAAWLTPAGRKPYWFGTIESLI